MFLNHRYIADVVESKNVRQILDRESIGVALSTHPDLPAKLGEDGLVFGSTFLVEQDFLTGLPCALYMNAAMNTTFVNRVSASVLKAFRWVATLLNSSAMAHRITILTPGGSSLKKLSSFMPKQSNFKQKIVKLVSEYCQVSTKAVKFHAKIVIF